MLFLFFSIYWLCFTLCGPHPLCNRRWGGEWSEGEPDCGGYWVYIIPMTSEEAELLSPGSHMLNPRELLPLAWLGFTCLFPEWSLWPQAHITCLPASYGVIGWRRTALIGAPHTALETGKENFPHGKEKSVARIKGREGYWIDQNDLCHNIAPVCLLNLLKAPLGCYCALATSHPWYLACGHTQQYLINAWMNECSECPIPWVLDKETVSFQKA